MAKKKTAKKSAPKDPTPTAVRLSQQQLERLDGVAKKAWEPGGKRVTRSLAIRRAVDLALPQLEADPSLLLLEED